MAYNTSAICVMTEYISFCTCLQQAELLTETLMQWITGYHYHRRMLSTLIQGHNCPEISNKISRHFLLTLHDTSPTHAVLPASNMHYISVQNVLISWKVLFKGVTQGLQQPTKYWHKLGVSNGQFNMARFLTDISLTAVKFHDIHRISRQVITAFCLQCFDAVGWAAGRASGL